MSDTALPAIAELVPHQPPMLLLDRLLRVEGEQLWAEVLVDAEGPFGDGLQVPAWVGIEYMAQAVAAWAGWRSHHAGGAAKLGLLLGTRRYQAHCPAFAHGQRLQVAVRCELLADNGLGAFSCSLHDQAQLLAEAQLSVFEPADAAAYLNEDSV